MQEALYNPTFGYYSASIREIGRRGDFTTWPAWHESLGRAIARWAQQTDRRADLIEIGAGSGALADSIVKALGWWHRPGYHIVEISPKLRALQQSRLGRRARWHDHMAAALAATGGRALIFSNELVDAFPCRVFERQAPGWRELALRLEAGRLIEVWRHEPLPDSTALACDWPEGQRVEVHESYRKWMEAWLPAWKSGRLLAVDYGEISPAVYHRRPKGTLRAFAHHQRLDGPDVFAGFGTRDITADVNFSDLLQWPPGGGTLETLGDFLSRHGIAPPASGTEAAGAFKVLEQTC